MSTINKTPVKITDVVLRDAHQSLFATRLRLDDMLPIAEKLDQIGFWSLETWGGATFDACIRYLGEDPWERIRELKKAMPNTKQQMLLRGQNLLGYRHYADDVVEKFVERAYDSGVEVFRVFDAMNDPRNFTTAMQAVKKHGGHAQGTLSYTISPVHNLTGWLDLAKRIEDMGADSLAIKDMAGILTPYSAFELVSELKKTVDIPIALHAHATAGLSSMTILKAIEAGIDHIDSAISSMSMTYGHSPTESIVATLQGTDRDSGLDLSALEEIATYFRTVRKKYSAFEGALRGVDARILIAQVPGGMLTNMENQLKEQGASDKFDQVLDEIPKVREDLGYIPLVTPTSQIVGTQAVLNVMAGERYKSISKETQGILKGEYGVAPAPYNEKLQQRVLDGKAVITCRPADLLEPELEKLEDELKIAAAKEHFNIADNMIDDVLTLALFPQVGLNFLKNRNNPDAFESAPTEHAPTGESANNTPTTEQGSANNTYHVTINGKQYTAKINSGNDNNVSVSVDNKTFDAQVNTDSGTHIPQENTATSTASGEAVKSPLSGNIVKILVQPQSHIVAGQTLIILEAMKMETEIKALTDGIVSNIRVKAGDTVMTGDILITL